MLRPSIAVCGVLAAAVSATGANGPVLFVDDDAPPGGKGSSWQTAYRHLQDALAAASNPARGISEIRVADGTYRPDRTADDPLGTGDRKSTFQLLSGVAIIGGFAGFGVPVPDARDLELYHSILSGDLAGNDGPGFAGNAENSFHVVTGHGTIATAVLDGVTVTAGNANGTGDRSCFGGPNHGNSCVDDTGCPKGTCISPDSLGAGILVFGGRPTFRDCRVVNNFAAFQGAGFLLKFGSDATITGCLIAGNRALDNGGGMYLGFSSPLVVDCEFIANSGGRYAGASCNRDHSNATFINCLFDQNTAAEQKQTGGGAIVNVSSSPTFTACTFSDNVSIFGNGGAMYNKVGFVPALGPSNPILFDCVFSGNDASGFGGAMYNIDGSAPDLTSCTFTGNSARYGAGLYNKESAPRLADCTFQANSAIYYGGVMYNKSSSPELVSCTLLANTATYGGGIYSDDSDVTATGCKFTGNTATYEGGGLYSNRGGALSLTDCIFRLNDSGNGGAVYDAVDGSYANCLFADNTAVSGAAIRLQGASSTLTNCVLTGNTASSEGGGIANVGDSAPTLTGCTIMGNVAGDDGGGIANRGTTSPRLADCTLADNVAWTGGGMSNADGAEPMLDRCTLRDNLAQYGGAMFSLDAVPTLANCTIIGNTAGFWGGAIHSSFSDTRLTNCLLIGNVAGGWGGALYNFRSCPLLTNCTITSNRAGGDAGGIFNHNNANPVLRNCILWKNTDSGPLDESAQISHFVASESIVSYTCFGGWTGSLGGQGNFSADPLFVDPLGADGVAGTADDDLRLQAGSPCIDAADKTALTPCDLDLDDNVRFADDPSTADTGYGRGPMVDIGSYEYGGTLPEDCNANGVADQCEVVSILQAQSGELSPIGALSPQAFTIVSPPEAFLFDVRLFFRAVGDLWSTTEYVDVGINGVGVGSVFVTSASGCPSLPDRDQLTVPAAVFNGAVAGGDAVIQLVPTANVDSGRCGSRSFITVAIEYVIPDTAKDANGNGVPDACETTPGDLDGDGDVDQIDLVRLISAWGPCPQPCPPSCAADFDGDCKVTVADLLMLLGNWG